MTTLSAFLLGLVQGVAEFLPISSSGHLSIAQNLLGMTVEENHFFDVLLHLGTLLAVLVAYWADIVGMVREFFLGIRDLARHDTEKVPPARRLVLLVIVGTLPLFLVLPIKDKVELLYSNMWFIGGALLVTGCLLFLSDRYNKGHKTEKTATIKDVLFIGVCQVVATAPGISRSGMTITAGCFRNFDRRFAVRFSFLLSIPAVLGANFLSLLDVIKDGGIDMALLPACLVGVLTAAVSGYLSICLLRFVAEKGRFGAFAYYCWAAGALTMILNILQ